MNHLGFETVDRHLKDICDNHNTFGMKLALPRGVF